MPQSRHAFLSTSTELFRALSHTTLGEILIIGAPSGISQVEFVTSYAPGGSAQCAPDLPIFQSTLGQCGSSTPAETRKSSFADVASLNSSVVQLTQEDETLVRDVVAVINGKLDPRRIPLRFEGTPFQREVWEHLRAIPSGCTSTYAEIAKAIGAPRAHRAVANACGANRLAIVIPCHRAVRADGSLGGYRWGVERKRALLDREKAQETSDAAPALLAGNTEDQR